MIIFIKYVIDNYLEGNDFPLELWNHVDSDERTNNRVEGFNNKLKKYCGAAEPFLFFNNTIQMLGILIRMRKALMPGFFFIIQKNYY